MDKIEGLKAILKGSGWRLYPRVRARLALDDDPFLAVVGMVSGCFVVMAPLALSKDADGSWIISDDHLSRWVRTVTDMAVQRLSEPVQRQQLLTHESAETLSPMGDIHKQQVAELWERVSPTQRRVIQAALELDTTDRKVLADHLGMSSKTVTTHMRRMRASA